MDFSTFNVLIFGASSGIGNCLCNMLYEKGFNVIGTFKESIINAFYDTYRCDISNESEVKNLFLKLNNKYKKIDAVINCAALCLDNDIENKSIDEFMRVLKVNLGGTFLVDKYAALNMDTGIIINISSTDAFDTYSPISMDYAASKAGVDNLTKNMAKRFPNLKIYALAPNWVDTPSVLSMNQDYLKKELKRVNQKQLLKKEDVALKIIDIMINNNYKSGDVIRMDGINE